MYCLIQTEKLGMELWVLTKDGVLIGQFCSEQAARSAFLRLSK